MTALTLDEVAARVRDLTPARVAEWAGVSPHKLARFVNKPQSITFTELSKIRVALAQIELADEVARDTNT